MTRRALFLLCFVLVAGAPQARANAPASTAGVGPAEALDGMILMDAGGRGAQSVTISMKPLPGASPAYARFAALNARLVLATNKPRRATAEARARPQGGSQRPARSATSPSADLPRVSRAGAPLQPVDGPAPGQGGYVHFFLLETPDGEGEIQIGIELPDGRIAWSFPEVGVGIMPFIRSGSVEVSGRVYGVEHLYGLRPFPDEESMAALRAALWDRIQPLVDGKTPYCNPFLRAEALCLSCLGFALEALFPGRLPGSPAMPADFPRTRSRLYYTTDDLLLYLTGFHEIATTEERARRIEQLKLPPYLTEELWQLVDATDMKDAASPLDTSRMKNGAAKPPAAGRSYTRTPPQRKRL